jgi:hypothetical protein
MITNKLTGNKLISDMLTGNKSTSNSLRKSPLDSATNYSVGTIMIGNDKKYWVVMKTITGVHKWIPKMKANINNLSILNLDYLSKHINKTIKIYSREYTLKWPKKNDKNIYIITFKPTGNLLLGKKQIINGLKNYAQYKNKKLLVEGYINFYPKTDKEIILSSLQIDYKTDAISTNLMNTELFYFSC